MRLLSSLLLFLTVMTLTLLTSTMISQRAALAATPAASLVAVADDDDDGDRRNGRKVFLRENCYVCHGGRGGGGMCPSLRTDPPDEDDVEEAVLDGTPEGMPSYRGRVTRQEIRDLAAYIESLGSAQEPTFTHWWERNPTR